MDVIQSALNIQSALKGKSMLQKTRLLVLATVASVAVLLSGCGGGGGGGTRPMADDGGSMMPGDGSTAQTWAEAVEDPTVAGHVADAIAKAAGAQPSPGSVTQSSNVDSNNISTDGVDITARYGSGGPSFSVRNGAAWSIDMNEGNPRRIPDTTPPWQGAELSKRITGGMLYVDAYTDIKAPTTVTAGAGPVAVMSGDSMAFTGNAITIGAGRSTPGTLNGQQGTFECAASGCRLGFGPGFSSGQENTLNTVSGLTFVPSGSGTVRSVSDADYLAGGVWLIVPDDASSAAEYVFGAFGTAADPFRQSELTTVQGTATYLGDATGLYSEKTGGSTEIGYFDGDVMLTADFGSGSALGTISGSITDFEVDGVPENGTLNLGTANIGSQNSGFFRGAVTGSDDERRYTGHWGGQFAGNGESDGKPGSVGGTFGGHSTDDAVNFVGVFGAHK